MNMIEILDLSFSYRGRKALNGVNLSVRTSEIFGLLGPNGSGKTTLMRILSTALPYEEGSVRFNGAELKKKPSEVRELCGVVFQSPSLDARLTVRENLEYHGRFYGLAGKELSARVSASLKALGVADRAGDLAHKLSGGLKRRVEIAKTLLHDPAVLILDEPSTGLDPAARYDLWKLLAVLRAERKITMLVTTHLMEEAEHCDRVAIMDKGRAVCEGRPDDLKKRVGGDVIRIETRSLNALALKIREKFDVKLRCEGGVIQIEHPHAAEWIPRLAESFAGEIDSITFRKPSLEDVFMHHTGQVFAEAEEEVRV